MHVSVTYNANLSDEEVKRVVRNFFGIITKERFVRDGKLMEEVHTSHKFDMDCDDQTDRELVESIQTTERLLRERKFL